MWRECGNGERVWQLCCGVDGVMRSGWGDEKWMVWLGVDGTIENGWDDVEGSGCWGMGGVMWIVWWWWWWCNYNLASVLDVNDEGPIEVHKDTYKHTEMLIQKYRDIMIKNNNILLWCHVTKVLLKHQHHMCQEFCQQVVLYNLYVVWWKRRAEVLSSVCCFDVGLLFLPHFLS